MSRSITFAPGSPQPKGVAVKGPKPPTPIASLSGGEEGITVEVCIDQMSGVQKWSNGQGDLLNCTVFDSTGLTIFVLGITSLIIASTGSIRLVTFNERAIAMSRMLEINSVCLFLLY